ncbi:D-alanyl-D-alanine carboxypeptidase family protein [Bacillus mexicanus]|uniref:serine hydrolase n=1 Tax=Bacillus mexicanus TaxID=2834415 RepID=UPI003D1C56E8
MKKWIGSILIAGLIVQIVQSSLGITSVKAEENNNINQEVEKNEPSIIGTNGAVIDAYSGKFLYTKNENEKAYPASITKVLTAILIKENLKNDDTITFSKRAASQEPSNQQILYKEGEKISVDDALESLMIISSNDVAFALAEAVAGSVEKFADMMNEKAKELGATNTHFETPNGLPNEKHFTTAHDMALFGREILKYPDIVEKMGQREAVIKTNERTVTIKSPNNIPEENPNAIGGKTGYTDAAQHTLIEILKKGDKKVIAVTMHSTKSGKYSDINVMSDYAFSKIQTKKLFEKGEVYHIFEMNDKEFPLTLKEDAVISYVGNEGKFTQSIKWNTSKKEYKAGETVAWLIVKSNGKQVGKFALKTNKKFAPNTVDKDKKSMGITDEASPAFPSNSHTSYVWTIAIIFLVPLFTFLFLNVMMNKKKKRSF